jgi:rRNA small subunit pseudouridine methyltransferase Nep1
MAPREFILVLAETALETVPEEIARHSAIKSDAARRGKEASEILLDRSLHHAAMLKLEAGESRGRPDIPYHVLLDVASSPLFRAGKLGLFVHTRGDLILRVSKGLRPPRSYDRFRNLMEQLLKEGRVGRDSDLITAEKGSLRELIKDVKPTRVVGLSRLGKESTMEEAVRDAQGARACFLIGGFPSGHFSKETEEALSAMVSVSPQGLDASLVACRLVYEIEKAEGVE